MAIKGYNHYLQSDALFTPEEIIRGHALYGLGWKQSESVEEEEEEN
jgi:hypothetical protein